MLGPITYLDAALIAIALVSGLLAMYRGFAREVLSIVSWIVAGIAVFYVVLFQRAFAQDMATQVGVPLVVSQIAIGAIVFLIVLIFVHLLTSRISDSILDSRIGIIDRVLGFMFGVLRGFVIVLVMFMGYVQLFPDKNAQVLFVSKAQSYDMLMSSGNALRGPLMSLVERFQTRTGTEQQGSLEPVGDHGKLALVGTRSSPVSG
jgi:membrane protein required for colicin V production